MCAKRGNPDNHQPYAKVGSRVVVVQAVPVDHLRAQEPKRTDSALIAQRRQAAKIARLEVRVEGLEQQVQKEKTVSRVSPPGTLEDVLWDRGNVKFLRGHRSPLVNLLGSLGSLGGLAAT